MLTFEEMLNITKEMGIEISSSGRHSILNCDGKKVEIDLSVRKQCFLPLEKHLNCKYEYKDLKHDSYIRENNDIPEEYVNAA